MIQDPKENPHDDPLTRRIWQLQERIRTTSASRFAASKRIRFDWNLAQLTVVVLSLWAITISYMLLPATIAPHHNNRAYYEAVDILLPMFIVVFSLIEHGENYLRSHQLDTSARQLREIGDELAAAVARAQFEETPKDREKALLDVFEKFGIRYNHSLERCPASHDDADHITTKYRYVKWEKTFSRKYRFFAVFVVASMWLLRHVKRIFYMSLWVAPILLFFLPASDEKPAAECPARPIDAACPH